MNEAERQAFWAQVFRLWKPITRHNLPAAGYYQLVSGELKPGMTAVVERVEDVMLASGAFIWRRKARAGQVLVRVHEFTPATGDRFAKLVGDRLGTRPAPRKRRRTK